MIYSKKYYITYKIPDFKIYTVQTCIVGQKANNVYRVTVSSPLTQIFHIR